MHNRSDKFSSKAEVISKLKKKTSLSIYQGLNKLDDENINEAADLLEKHLQNFPSDAAAKILLGKTYAKLGRYHQASQLIKSAADTIHSPHTLEFYQKEIEMMIRKEKYTMPEHDFKSKEKINLNDSEEFKTSESDQNSSGEHELVSETLAKIYISQGEINEAIKIYNKLIERKPENKEKYFRLINELKLRLE